MQLIIAEKPMLGKAIADAIPGAGATKDAVIYKGDYAVCWAYGHLLELKEPEDYDAAFKKWEIAALPIHFPNWGKRPNTKSSGHGSSPADRLKQIGGLLKQADSVICAGDPDDEGQYLIDEILEWFHYTGPAYRMDTGDTTQAALAKALHHLRDNKACEPAGRSAYARSVADLMVGVNLTRYFTLSNPGTLLTVGRVQTPTLGLVVNRDYAIENHVKTLYYDITTHLNIDGTAVDASYEAPDSLLDDGKLTDKAVAQQKCSELTGAKLNPVEVKYTEGLEQPPLPFNLVKLQSYCSSKFGYDPTQVMEITQSLRDNHSAITYNRSDCQYLSEEQYKEAPATMQQVIKNIGFSPKGMDMSLHSKAYNDKNITAHTAIIPQNQHVDLSKLTEQEKNVYLAIVKYFMIQFMPPAKKGKTSLKATAADGGKISASSTKVLDKGYLALFKGGQANGDDGEEENESALSSLQPGTYSAIVSSADMTEKETKPPARYTKASLNEDMTRIAKYVQDANIKQLLLSKDKDKKGENGSIGTSATRASIIDGLVAHGYLEEQGKKLVSTALGRELCRILPDELTRPDLTAKWWAIQEDIQAGNASPDVLTNNVLDMIRKTLATQYPTVDLSKIPASLRRGGGTREALGKCPRCGCDVIEGKTGFGCSGWKAGCKFVIWKNPKSTLFSQTTFTATDVKKALAGKPIHKTSLVSMKTGTPKAFEADLIMDDDPNSQFGPNFKLDFSHNRPKTKRGSKGPAARRSGQKKKGGAA